MSSLARQHADSQGNTKGAVREELRAGFRLTPAAPRAELVIENYTLGLQLLGFARAMRGSFSLARTGRVYLRELVTRFNESTYLAVLHGDRGIFVDVQETSRDLRLVGPIGADVHFHATAAGKAMAAHFPATRRAAILATRPRTRLTPRTRATRAEVEREWARVRRTGAAINNEETIVGTGGGYVHDAGDKLEPASEPDAARRLAG